MDRTLVENAITKFYQRRLTNELAPCLECFADNVKFRLAGAENQSSFSAAVKGKAALQPILLALTSTWKWSKHETESITIEGSKAAVRFLLTVTYAPTGVVIVTEIMDEIVFDENQQIIGFVEFVDTETVARLSS
jgi:hypothetical protein